jgi:hypothetical protein
MVYVSVTVRSCIVNESHEEFSATKLLNYLTDFHETWHEKWQERKPRPNNLQFPKVRNDNMKDAQVCEVGAPLTALLGQSLRYDKDVKRLTLHQQIHRTQNLPKNFYTKKGIAHIADVSDYKFMQ